MNSIKDRWSPLVSSNFEIKEFMNKSYFIFFLKNMHNKNIDVSYSYFTFFLLLAKK